MILFVNACVRPESRTRRLADCLLGRLDGTVKEITLIENDFPKMDADFIRGRDQWVESADYSSPVLDYAKDFAAADTIVIAAPYWDLSFPAALKQYLEQICVSGITFYYENGVPKGLCRAEKLYYITTAGGPVYGDFGYGYVRTLAQVFFGIAHTECVQAEGLDMPGADEEQILRAAEEKIAAGS